MYNNPCCLHGLAACLLPEHFPINTCEMKIIFSFAVVVLSCLAFPGHAQEINKEAPELTGKLMAGLNRRVDKAQEKIVEQTERYLHKMQKLEKAILKKYAAKDPAAARSMFGNIDDTYAGLLKNSTVNHPLSNVYSSKLDSLKTGLQFLTEAGLLKNTPQYQEQVKNMLAKYEGLQSTFNQTEAIKKFLAQRQHQLKEQLEKLNIPAIKKWKRQVYYDRAQMSAYKDVWEDPSAIENKLIGMLRKVPEFRHFFNQYSGLGSVFQLPGSTATTGTSINLQTRDMLNAFIQNTRGSTTNPQSLLQNNLPAPSAGTVTNLLPAAGGNELEMPGFRPNGEKVKPFLKRLEFGTSFQSTKSNSFFPATTDIALLVGYRLNDRSVVGIGGSGKIGWGNGFRAMRISGQGLSVRSYVDVKWKGNWWISGGWEYHYQVPFESMRRLYAIDDWKGSALLGVSKIIPLKAKGLKKYRIQLLYDFLHKQKLPVSEPLKIRIGYSF
jgi:hypothetical protein